VDTIGLPSAERKKIIDALFGDNGIALAEMSIMFGHKVEEIKKLCLFFPIPGIALIISVLKLGTNNFFQGADQICEVLGFSDSVSILRMLFIDSLLLLVQSLLSFIAMKKVVLGKRSGSVLEKPNIHVLCSRHLKDNTIKHLVDTIGLPSAERKKIIDSNIGPKKRGASPVSFLTTDMFL
jgi:hypothetical protein